ncbi:unnamed protein product [Schistocephalus solidus]|uniref:Uncharacterized protein n=1 Tax=Schistocephalus solidus TaxID=70667 RepID=A0A183SJM0_SCHSO|nr:unnamed protein product [Schistocephalus solidus]
MARQESGQGNPGVDRNPQHPRHAEESATAMDRLPNRLFGLVGLVGHLRTQCNKNLTTSTSDTPASNPTTTTTQTTDNNFIDVPSSTITDTILLPPPVAPIKPMNTTCPTPATSVAPSDYLPTASSTTTAPSTSDRDWVLTCPHFDRTFI